MRASDVADNTKLKSFFQRIPRISLYAHSVFFFIITVFLALTILSRLGFFNLLGVSVVATSSMEPVIKPGDMVIYLNTHYAVRDIVVYCLTPSHCVVHRIVDFLTIDTVDGKKLFVITKGDANPAPDSPFELEKIRGKVVFTVPRELWLPILLFFIAYSLYGIARYPVVGISFIVLFIVGLVCIAVVYAVIPQVIVVERVKAPILSLTGVYFDADACTVSIRYTGELSLTEIDIKVNSTSIELIQLADKEVSFKPKNTLLNQAFENGKPLLIEVKASLNRVARLNGKYTLLVGGKNPELRNLNGILLVSNLNCFPVSINVSLKYTIGDHWMWLNKTYIIEGFSYLFITPPEDAELAYAYVYWLNQGDLRWIGMPLKTRYLEG